MFRIEGAILASLSLLDENIHKRIIEKKVVLDSHRPFDPIFLKRLRHELMIEYTYNSNAIEGSTLTLNETRLVLEEGLTIGSKPLQDSLGAKNHLNAIDFIEKLVYENAPLTEEDVLKLHSLILHEIGDYAGKYRKVGVRIAGATFSPPKSVEVPRLINELMAWLEKNLEEYSPIEQAALFHHRFVHIHPFSDGNGRAARLLMNAILMKKGYPFIINITQKERKKYLDSLQEADLGNYGPFINYIARSAENVLDIYLNALEEPKIITLTEASEITPYSVNYLGLLARKGRIGAFKENNRWYVKEQEILNYEKEMMYKKHKREGLIK